MEVAIAPNSAGSEWFACGGLPEREAKSANAYAQRLIRYIADASTVRARCLDEFGTAPPVEKIRRWRADWARLVERRRAQRAAHDYGEEDPDLDAANDDPAPSDTFEAFCATVALRLAAIEAPQPGAPPAEQAPRLPRAPLRTHGEVIERCAVLCGVSPEAVLGMSRKHAVVRARQLAATVLRARGNSYPQVGRFLGGIDHSSVIHAVRVLFDVKMRDPAMVEAWMIAAPCAAKFARSAEELDLIMNLRRGNGA